MKKKHFDFIEIFKIFKIVFQEHVYNIKNFQKQKKTDYIHKTTTRNILSVSLTIFGKVFKNCEKYYVAPQPKAKTKSTDICGPSATYRYNHCIRKMFVRHHHHHHHRVFSGNSSYQCCPADKCRHFYDIGRNFPISPK